MRCRDCFDEYTARNKNTKERVTLLKVKSASDADRIHARFPLLEQCNSEFLVKYEGEIQEDNTLWVGISYCVDGRACNEVQPQ